MRYAKIVNGQVAEYPFTLEKLRREYLNTSFPRELSEGLLAEYNVYPVVPSVKPTPTLTQSPAEQAPQLINGAWTQVWGMVDVSTEVVEKRQLKADAFIQNFISMTPAQVEAYVANNTANLAQVRSLLGKMALMLLILARREFR